jgi:hypothetical protein
MSETHFVQTNVFTTAHFRTKWKAATGSRQSANRCLILTLRARSKKFLIGIENSYVVNI